MNKKTIIFDFDGVIHRGYTTYKDGSIYGEIDMELLDYIDKLMNDYYVVISSNRPAKQIVDYLNDLNIKIKFELFNKSPENLYWNKDNIVGVTNQKAIGILYIDDRAYRYNKIIDTKSNINKIDKLLNEIERG